MITLASKKKLTPQEDARFEEFLKKQFAELKRELEKHPQGGLQKKEGKVLQLTQAPQSRASKGTWKYGIAAAVLVAVAVPMIMQLNQQKADLANQMQAPAIEQEKQESAGAAKQKGMVDTKTAKEDPDAATGKADGFFKKKSKPAKKIADKEADIDSVSDVMAGERADANLNKSREETVSRDRFAAAEAPAGGKDADKDTLALKAETKPRLREAMRESDERGASADDSRNSAARVAQASPAAPAPTAAPGTPSASAGMASRDEAPAKPASRSIAIGDAQEKQRKQDASEEEKAEMEKLWKEFEKDPKSFSRDSKRSARLKVLLARHDTKSKTRAKRVKTAESQLTH